MRFAVSITARSRQGEDTMFHHNLTIREAGDADMAIQAAQIEFFRRPARKSAKVMTIIVEPIE